MDLGVFRGEPIELIGGQLVVAEPQGPYHASAITKVDYGLRAVLPPGWIVRLQAPVSLDDESELREMVANPEEEEVHMSAPESTIIAVGDVHGELEGLREILRHARVLGDRDRWIGGDRILVQTGDMIDRGPQSREAYALLGKLQAEAPVTSGTVIRLIGNHELELLQGNYRWANYPRPKAFQETLRSDVLSGAVRGAYAGQGYLFTHAGVRGDMQKHLLQGETVGSGEGKIIEVLAAKINRLLIEAVAGNHFTDLIFRIGRSRGGRHPVGGVFWEDASLMMASARAGVIRQVFGHTPRRRVEMSPSKGRVDIDVGIHYYGSRAYLVVRGGEPVAVTVR